MITVLQRGGSHYFELLEGVSHKTPCRQASFLGLCFFIKLDFLGNWSNTYGQLHSPSHFVFPFKFAARLHISKSRGVLISALSKQS